VKTLAKEIEALEEYRDHFRQWRKSGRSYLKYAAIFVLGLGLTASVSYTVYQKQIATETVLVETAVQNK
jgi:hypothetical protein